MKHLLLAAYTAVFLFMVVHFIPKGTQLENEHYEGYPEEAEGSKKEMSDYFFRMLRDPATNEIPRHIRQKELEFAATLPTDMDDDLPTKSNFPNTYWNVRGPMHVGGMTRVLAMDVANPNILIAGTNSGGIWRSTNAGQSWSETLPKAKYDGATCIVQDKRPGHTNTWYIGSGDPYASAGAGGRAYYLGNGIKKSTDNGVTWTQCNTAGNQFSFDNYFDFVYNIDMRNYNGDSTLYAACYSAVMKSTNGGQSWSIAKGNNLAAASNSFYTDVCVTPNGVVYATLSSDGGGSKGIWRSTDGVTFVNITPSIISSTYDLIKIGYAPSDENQVYFMVSQSTNYGLPDTNYVGEVNWKMLLKYNYLSGDGSGTGGKWTDLSLNLPSTGGPFDKLNLQTSYNMVVKVHPTDTNIVFIGGTNLYRSTTAFKDNAHTTFCGGYEIGAALPVVENYENHHPDQHELLFHPSNPNQVFCANDGGVFRCDNILAPQISWTSLNQGYLTTMFYTVAMEHTLAGDNTVIGGAQDNGTWFTNSAASNATWVHPNGGDGAYCAIADGKSKYFFSLQKGKIRMCNVDNNGTVTSFSRIEPIGAKNYEFINPFVIDPNTNNQMYLPEGTKMWRNNNLGGIPMNNNWDSISTNWEVMTDTLPFAGSITAVAISKAPANILYYGTDTKKVYKVVNANVSPTTAVDITPSLANAAGFVSCIAIHPADANKVMVTYSNYAVYSIFYTEDGGLTWKKVGGNLEQFSSGSGNGPSVRWAQIVPYNADTTAFFVATSTGLYATVKLRTDVDSTVWVQQGTDQIGNAVCTMIDYRAVDGQMVVATHSRGIYSAKIDKNYFLGIKRRDIVARSFAMNVYPNPIQTSATVEYELAASSQVQIHVTDMMGKQVRMLDEGWQPKGTHQVYIQRNELPAGLYYCTVQAGGIRKTKTLVVQ